MPSIDDIQAAIRAVAADRIRPSAAAVDATREFPAQNLRALGDAGALGLVVPGSLGGAGGGLVALSLACETLGSACASTAMVYLMHSVTAATVAAGGGVRAADVAAALSTGSVGTLAFSERGTGAHFYAPELKVHRTNGSVQVSGTKSFVTSGGQADLYLLLVQSDEDGAADAYVVERGAAGLSFEGEWQGLGMAGNSSIAMRLHDVALENDARIGLPGQGVALVFEVVAPCFLVGLAATNVGIAAAATAAAAAHARGRTYPDGTSLAEIPYIQHLLADMDLKTRAARLLVRDAAALGEHGDPTALVAIMEAKVAATEAAAEVTRLALTATGGQGYTPSLPIERHFRDAHAGAVMAPTNAVLRSWIGKALTGLPVP
ncbi:MAG: acyl-CoA dehydrogenase family protein [Actinomycetota bacterium]